MAYDNSKFEGLEWTDVADEKTRPKRMREAAWQKEEGGHVGDQPADVEEAGPAPDARRSRGEALARPLSPSHRARVQGGYEGSLAPRGLSPRKPLLVGRAAEEQGTGRL